MPSIVKTNPDADLVAAFLASRQPKVVPAGARAYTPAEMKRLTEGDKTVQTKYLVRLTGEDGMEWTEEVAANSPQHALDWAKRCWPEARVDITAVRPMYY
jgi:hypothetical protein